MGFIKRTTTVINDLHTGQEYTEGLARMAVSMVDATSDWEPPPHHSDQKRKVPNKIQAIKAVREARIYAGHSGDLMEAKRTVEFVISNLDELRKMIYNDL